jgi:hypothetical protein
MNTTPVPGSATVLDSTSNENHGTTDAGFDSAHMSTGPFGEEYDVAGSDAINLDDAFDGLRSTDSLTFEFHCMPRDEDKLFGNYWSNSYPGIRVDLNTSAKPRLYARVGGKRRYYYSNEVMTLDEYHYLATIYDNQDISIYLNGSLTTGNYTYSDTLSDLPFGPSNEEWLILGSGTQGEWDGKISEARISDVERSAAWIKATYHVLADTLGALAVYAEPVDKITFTIDADNVDAELTDFPVGVKIDDTTGFLTGKESTDWQYLHCTVDDVECYVEVELWDPDNDLAVLWVCVPTVSNTTDTVITIEKTAVDNTATYVGETGDAAAQNVWDDDFVAVYHMAQDPSGGADCILDSTSNGNDATPAGSMTSGDLVSSGFGKSIEFDGSDDEMDSTDVDVGNTVTVEAYSMSENALETQSLVGKDDYPFARQWQFRTDTISGDYYQTRAIVFEDNSTYNAAYGPASYQEPTNFYHQAFTYDGSDISVFVDGTAGTPVSHTGGMANCGNVVTIGSVDTNTHNWLHGKISEARVSKTVRSAAWIKATYHVLADTLGALAVYAEPVDKITFTIDADNVDAELTDFPVGVKIDNTTGFLTGKTSTDWQYLHCTVDDVECYVEIETWDPSNDLAVLWVCVPTVSNTTDTVITIEKTAVNNHEIEVTSPTVWDDFTGEDDDYPPLWYTHADTSAGGSIGINSNKLRISIPETANDENITVRSRFKLSGDFDIQIDFEEISNDPPSSSNSYPAKLILNGDDFWFHICTYLDSSGNKRVNCSGTLTSSTTISVDLSSAKFRLTRVNSTIKAYYWSGSQWEWNGSTAGLTSSESSTADVKISLNGLADYNSGIVTDWDNLQVNSCDSITGYIGEAGDVAAQNVWDDDFVAVYHMAQDPSGGSGCLLDSTSNERTATPAGSMTSGDLVDGDFGKAIDFDGSDDYFTFDDNFPNLSAEDVTIEAFFKMASNTSNSVFIDHYNPNTPYQGYALSVRNKKLGFIPGGTYSGNGLPSLTNVDDNAYHHCAGVLNATSAAVYIDGDSDNTGPLSNQMGWSGTCYIGNTPWSEIINACQVSDLRVSKVARSAAWLKATHHVLADTFGALAVYAEPVDKITATIDADNVDAELTDFPVGVKIDNTTGFLTGKTSTDWQYLHCTVDDVECYVEIETWDPSNDLAVLWVCVPTVSSTTDTVITIEKTAVNNHEIEVTSPTVWDDFTGTDGAGPYMFKKSGSGADYLTIQSNALNFTRGVVNADETGSVVSRFQLSGAFDIQFDFDIATEVASTNGSYSYMAFLQLFRAANDAFAGGIGTSIVTGLGTQYCRRTTGSYYWANRSVTSGKFRITRDAGGEIKGFYWNATSEQWEWDGSTAGGGIAATGYTYDLYCKIVFRAENNGSFDANVDNFTINSCDSITGYIGETGDVPAQNVWDDDFVAVYHMAQDPSGGANCILDSTDNEYNGTPYGTMTAGDLVDGDFGKALDLDGTDDYIEINDARTPLSEGTDATVEAFAASDLSQDGCPVSINTGTYGNVIVNVWRSTGYSYITAPFSATSPSIVFSENTFHHSAIVYDANDLEQFVDGVSAITDTAAVIFRFNDFISIGQEYDTGANKSDYFPGKISEIRLSKVARSDAWIKATYHVLADTLLTIEAVGGEEPGEPPVIPVYQDIRFSLDNITGALTMGTPGPGCQLDDATDKLTLH